MNPSLMGASDKASSPGLTLWSHSLWDHEAEDQIGYTSILDPQKLWVNKNFRPLGFE